MPSRVRTTRIVSLGELVAAIFDEVSTSPGRRSSGLAASAVADLLLRTGHAPLLRTLENIASPG